MSEHSKPAGSPTLTGSAPAGPFVRLLDRLVGRPMQLVVGLVVVCVFLAVGDLLYHKHAKFEFEEWPFFFPVFGFVVYSAVIFAAKALRLVIRRPEDYYAPYSTDAETPNRHVTGDPATGGGR